MKAMLIIDMPKNCYDCELNPCHYHYYDCPLKPMPQKKTDFDGHFIDEYASGYNACIDEIWGEEK